MVLPDSDKIPRVPSYSGSSFIQLYPCRLRGFHPLRLTFPVPFNYRHSFLLYPKLMYALTTTPYYHREATVHAYHTSQFWALPRSLAATQGISFDFFSSRYLDGSVPWVYLHHAILFTWQCVVSIPRGLPHSAICGSLDVCSSPQLFAAYHGLLRRTAPRHPP